MTPDTTAAIVLIAGSLLWLVAEVIREWREVERDWPEPDADWLASLRSDTPIHDELVAERFRADLADDEALGRWSA